MTAREYLKQIQKANFVIARMENEIVDLREDYQSVSGVAISEKVQASPKPDRFAESYIKIEQKEEELSQERQKYLDLKLKILKEINAIPDTRYVKVLYAKYVDGLSYTKVAEAVGYSFRHTVKLCDKAVETFGSMYQDMLAER